MPKYIGVDALLPVKYKNTLVANFQDGIAMGSFQFVEGAGNSILTAQQVLSKYKLPAYRMNCQWDDDHNYQGKLGIVKKRAQAYNQKIVLEYPKTKHYYSPYTEYQNLSKAVLVETYNILRDILGPNVVIVFNPQDASEPYLSEEQGYQNVAVELHHKHYKKVSKRMIFSYDGYDFTDSDIARYLNAAKDAEIFFIWGWRNNGKASGKREDNLPRPKRVAWLSPDELRAQIFTITTPKGNVKWNAATGIYKAYSEFETFPNPVEKARQGKPVLLLSKKATKVEFKKRGKVIETLTYDGLNAEEQKHVYRSKRWGYEIALQSYEILPRNYTVGVFADGVSIGRINPAYREGTFR